MVLRACREEPEQGARQRDAHTAVPTVALGSPSVLGVEKRGFGENPPILPPV